MRFNENQSLPTAKWFCPSCQVTTTHKLIRLGTRGEIHRYKCNVCGSIFDAPKTVGKRLDNRLGGYRGKAEVLSNSRKRNSASWQKVRPILLSRKGLKGGIFSYETE